MAEERIRVRHGVYADPIIGLYRAVREVNGHVQWLGPWTTETKADEIAASQAQLVRDTVTDAGGHYEQGDTPLDIWIPATTRQEAPA